MSFAKIHPLDRPREKFIKQGAHALSDTELLTAVLGSGTARRDVLRIAGDVSKLFREYGDALTLSQLLTVAGMGTARAIKLLAAREFFRRSIVPHGTKIFSPSDLLPRLRTRLKRSQELFFVATLNGAQELLELRTIAMGLVDRVVVHPREVFADALIDRASAVIIAHSHSTSDLKPSRHDRKLTRQLKEAGVLLGIRVLDHVIFNERDYYSFLENKIL